MLLRSSFEIITRGNNFSLFPFSSDNNLVKKKAPFSRFLCCRPGLFCCRSHLKTCSLIYIIIFCGSKTDLVSLPELSHALTCSAPVINSHVLFCYFALLHASSLIRRYAAIIIHAIFTEMPASPAS